jgi:RNA ligase
MSIFPFITNLEEFKQNVGEKQEIKYMLQPNGTTVCSYVVACEDTFDNIWAKECRGVVFDKDGNVISRPLTKFFNVNERPETHASALDWTKIVRVMDKRDGSMIHTVKVDDLSPFDCTTFDVKSKKSYESDVAVQAREFMAKNINFRDFCEHVTRNNMTAIFEWTSPTARIVLYYEDSGLQLLHIRKNDTGEYLMPDALYDLASKFGIPVVEPDSLALTLLEDDFSKLFDLSQTLEGKEGWVIQFEDGNMVKLKTKWYLERHRAMTFLRERDIALMTLREELDDLKSLLVGEGANIDEIIEIEARVVKMLNEIETSVEVFYEEVKDMDRKSVALEFGPNGNRSFKYFKLLMQRYSGMSPDYKAYFESNCLREAFGLRQLNLVQSSAEID